MILAHVVREKNTNNVAGSSINKGLAENLESLKINFVLQKNKKMTKIIEI